MPPSGASYETWGIVTATTGQCNHFVVSNLMHGKHRKTLAAIFTDPARADVRWMDIEALLLVCGAIVSEGRGSRLHVTLNGVDAVFHSSHPKPETDKGALEAVRRFLREAGIEP